MKDNYEWVKLEDRGITAVGGFRTAGIAGGIKKDKKDLAVIYSLKEAVAAGVFTKNQVQAAPVLLCKERLINTVRAVIVNSGNANACTGEQGLSDAYRMAALAAEGLKIDTGQVLVSSTGVIGEPLPMQAVEGAIFKAIGSLGSGHLSDASAAEAILTTDTVIKQTAYRCVVPGGEFHIAGMAKGSGMICPNMATMLAFLVTDAKIERSLLQELFSQACDNSFNVITVDGDTSTNDTALIMANGAAENITVSEHSGGSLVAFKALLEHICRELALQIVADGEGLTKLITLTIRGAADIQGARIMARSILNSPLVKTAFYGEDANWGRILAALGYAGVAFDPGKVDIFIGSHKVAANGGAYKFSEKEVKKVLEKKEVQVVVDLKEGSETVTAWGTDMSHEYISINSNYRS